MNPVRKISVILKASINTSNYKSHNSKVGIDVYLEPLIDDLEKLWSRVLTYDVSRKQNFVMKEILMWTINDFPTYGMLSGCGTHDKFFCPHCMEHKKLFTLQYERKSCSFDSHRRFLPSIHPFRTNKKPLEKGKKNMMSYHLG